MTIDAMQQKIDSLEAHIAILKADLDWATQQSAWMHQVAADNQRLKEQNAGLLRECRRHKAQIRAIKASVLAFRETDDSWKDEQP